MRIFKLLEKWIALGAKIYDIYINFGQKKTGTRFFIYKLLKENRKGLELNKLRKVAWEGFLLYKLREGLVLYKNRLEVPNIGILQTYIV